MSPRSQLAAVLSLLGLCTVGCSQEEPETPPILRPVRTLIAQPSTDVSPETYAGVSRAGIESRLSFRVSGTIEQLAVKLGDRVGSGQVLARLDPTDFRLQVEEAEASLAQARAAVRQAAADYDRARALYENNNASKAELDAARANAESADAQMEAGELRLTLSRQQLGYTKLRSPLAGAIAEVAVETNENVQAGEPVVILASDGSPEIQVAVAENLVGRLQNGQEASITFDALPGERFVGHITEVGVASRGAATFDAVIELDPTASNGIRSGMAAEVTFLFASSEEPMLRLPPLAIGEDSRGRYVFVLKDHGDGTGSVHRQSVEVGDIEATGVRILSGLEPGTEVVTAGVRRLVEGMEVKVLTGSNSSSDSDSGTAPTGGAEP